MFTVRIINLVPCISRHVLSRPTVVTMRPVLSRPMSRKVKPSPSKELSLISGTGAVASAFCFTTLISFINPGAGLMVCAAWMLSCPALYHSSTKTNLPVTFGPLILMTGLVVLFNSVD